jgi:chromosome partitioning protein
MRRACSGQARRITSHPCATGKDNTMTIDTLPATFKDLPRPDQTRVIVVANQKGGVGKTTTTVNLAASLALHGAMVLVIDLDPQGNASTALGIDNHNEDMLSVYDVLLDGKPIDDVMQSTEFSSNLYCVPSNIDLAGAEIELVSLVSRENRLKNALEASEMGWDYILIDCPPSLGLLTTNALTAGKEILVPIQTEYYALEGVGQLMKTISIVQQHLNPHLHISTVLLTMFNGATRLSRQVEEEVRSHFGETVLKTKIPRQTQMGEAPSHGQTIIEYAPSSSGALSYTEAARELAQRGA